MMNRTLRVCLLAFLFAHPAFASEESLKSFFQAVSGGWHGTGKALTFTGSAVSVSELSWNISITRTAENRWREIQDLEGSNQSGTALNDFVVEGETLQLDQSKWK